MLVGFWESCGLLHLRGVISFFLCFRSELATEVVLHGTIRLDSKVRSQNVHFYDPFPALLLRRIRPWYGTFYLMVFQRNCAWGRTGHMIMILLLFTHSYMYITKNWMKYLHVKSKKLSTISYYTLLRNIVKSYHLSTLLLLQAMLKSKKLKAKWII